METERTSLIVKASYGRCDPLVKRLTFRNYQTLSFEIFKRRLQECFSAPHEDSSTRLIYVDDDGLECLIASDNDLAEAIEYFADDETTSSASSSRSTKCTMRLLLIPEEDSLSLSDAGSSSQASTSSRSFSYSASDRQSLQSGPSNRYRAPQKPSPLGRHDPSNYGRHSSGSSEDSFYHDNPALFDEPYQGHHRPERGASHRPRSPRGHRGMGKHRGRGHHHPDPPHQHPDRWPKSFEGHMSDNTFLGAHRRDSFTNATSISSDDHHLVKALQALTLASNAVPSGQPVCKGCLKVVTDSIFPCLACSYREKDVDNGSDDGTQRIDGDKKSTKTPSVVSDNGRENLNEEEGYMLCQECIRSAGDFHVRQETSASGSVSHSFAAFTFADDRWQLDQTLRPNMQCSGCNSTDSKGAWMQCLICPTFTLCFGCFLQQNFYHKHQAFQCLVEPNKSSSSATSSLLKGYKHSGVSCGACLQEIVGPRLVCSRCGFDICAVCDTADRIPPAFVGFHDDAHILLKIKLPLRPGSENFMSAIDDAKSFYSREESDCGPRFSRRGSYESRFSDHDRWHPGHLPHHHDRGPPPPPFFSHHEHGPPPPPPPFGHHPSHRHGSPGPKHWRNMMPAPIYVINANSTGPGSSASSNISAPLEARHADYAKVAAEIGLHQLQCNNCATMIIGERYLCAMCPVEPGFSLCGPCVPFAATVHPVNHVFLRLAKPLSRPIQQRGPLLPSTLVSNSSISPSSDGFIHKSIECDGCQQAIRGPWLRCCDCPSYDLCQDCLHRGCHSEANHIFARFERPVNMSVFKELTGMGTNNPQNLLKVSLI